MLDAIETLFVWIPLILQGFLLNLAMSLIAMAIATVAGFFVGMMLLSRSAAVRLPTRFVNTSIRNSPWLVVLFIFLLTLPFEVKIPGFGVAFIPDWLKATIAFSLPVTANVAEIVRGAIRSVPTGQTEAAESLAFTRRQIFWRILLPQCYKRMLPPWMNWYALLALGTPLAAILGVQEALGTAQEAMEAAGGKPEFLVPFYGFLLLLFFVYIYPIALYTQRLERRYAVKD